MSRGPGVAERAVLASVSDEWLSVDAVLTTLNIRPGQESRSERESVRRAMRSLTRKGVVRSRHAGGELQVAEPYDDATRQFLDHMSAAADPALFLQEAFDGAFR